MGAMTNAITPLVSSVTQHRFVSDKKNIPIAFVASKCKIMNQKHHLLPFAPTSCASFSSQETPSFDTNNIIALFLCQIIFSSAESKSFGYHSESISKNTSFSSNHGSSSISTLSSMTATPLRTVPFTMIPFEKKNIQKMLRGSSTPSTHVYYFLHLLFVWILTIGLRNL
jgi:hypothetical protein